MPPAQYLSLMVVCALLDSRPEITIPNAGLSPIHSSSKPYFPAGRAQTAPHRARFRVSCHPWRIHMARLESQSKLLYYPTPNHIAETIATWFSAPRPTRLADPCCGTGEALVRFSQGFKEAERIGIELSYSRAEQAARVLDKVLPTSFYTATWSVQSVGLLFDNPPYDYSQNGEIVNGVT